MAALRAFGSLIARHAWFQRAGDARCYVLDGHQHVQLEIGGFDFVGLRFRIETVPQIIVLALPIFCNVSAPT